MKFREFLEHQIQKGKIEWESRSELIRASGSKVNGNTNKILKEFENKFKFGSITEIKNKEIYKYFKLQPKNSYISVEGAVKIINKNLPKKAQISETIIYNRLGDPKFNTNNLKGQTLDNQVSKTEKYNIKVPDLFKEKLRVLRKPGIYLYLETTQSGNTTLRLKTSDEYGNLDKSFPPNEDSIKTIKKLII
jgi:hypothetical protein|tara:strand:+ start:670 stop:1242 length:573 start_codon:yes stop_codon:yes gene_type:complete